MASTTACITSPSASARACGIAAARAALRHRHRSRHHSGSSSGGATNCSAPSLVARDVNWVSIAPDHRTRAAPRSRSATSTSPRRPRSPPGRLRRVEVRVRRAAARRHSRPGRGLLRWGSCPGRRLDRIAHWPDRAPHSGTASSTWRPGVASASRRTAFRHSHPARPLLPAALRLADSAASPKRNLAMALPESTQPERARIVDGCFQSLARLMALLPRFPAITKANVHEWIRYEGFEHFEEAKRQGRGVLFATAHLGNWEFSAFAHALMAEPMTLHRAPAGQPPARRPGDPLPHAVGQPCARPRSRTSAGRCSQTLKAQRGRSAS